MRLEQLQQENLPKEQHGPTLPMIQTLLPDVLRDIFRRCLPPFKYQESTNFELDKPPYTLAKVCRHWRSVCLSTPLLWAYLPTVSTDSAFTPDFAGLWRTKLTLSSPCDLRLFLEHHGIVPMATLAERFQPIQAAFPRVRTLELCTNIQILCLISQHADMFERLHTLKINLIDDFTGTLLSSPQLDFHTKVRSLTLQTRKRAPLSPRLLECVQPLWPNLTQFDGDYLPASSLRDILSAAPLLAHLTIRNAQTTTSLDSPSSLLIHSHLKTLHLICKSVGDPGVPVPIDLNGIHLPELEDFVFQYSLPTVPSTFLSFLEHTQGSIQNLHIGGIFESPFDQTAMYDLCPRLEALTMVNANDGSLEQFSRIDSLENKTMCRRLRRLTLPSFRLDPECYFPHRLTVLTSLRSKPAITVNCIPLESLTVVVTKSSDFLHFRALQEYSSISSYAFSVDFPAPELQRNLLAKLKRFGRQLHYPISLLDDLGIIPSLKGFVDRKTESPDTQSLHEEARRVYTNLKSLLDHMQTEPHWKIEKDPTLKKNFVKFVFKNHLVSQP